MSAEKQSVFQPKLFFKILPQIVIWQEITKTLKLCTKRMKHPGYGGF